MVSTVQGLEVHAKNTLRKRTVGLAPDRPQSLIERRSTVLRFCCFKTKTNDLTKVYGSAGRKN